MDVNITRRAAIQYSMAAMASSQLGAKLGSEFRPEDFGARGDGRTNDTRAFAALSAELNRSGGGTIIFGRGKIYLVGEQIRGGSYAWTPSPILELRGLRLPLRIIGNGAHMLCQPGLKFGTFDKVSGDPVHRPMPNFKRDEIASPYRGMIVIEGCQAAVEISDLELDGNIERLQIGGPYGDKGRQIPATGLLLIDNGQSETVVEVLSHHHGLDGAMINGADRTGSRSSIRRFIARHNGRQGMSIIAGRGYDFEDCEFSHTGRTVVTSAPAAGVDIEAEKSPPIRDLSFTRCKFVDNVGVGMVADSGDSEGARFSDCLFVGTTSWSAWPKKPGFTFDRCIFVGAVVRAFADEDPARATQFRACRFTDDPSMSPTGKVFEGGKTGGPIVNLARSQNILFDDCSFDLHGLAVLPWSWRATYRNCIMSQRSNKTAMTKGKYLGRTVIKGPVDLYGSMVIGTLILNGRVIPPGPRGVAAW